MAQGAIDSIKSCFVPRTYKAITLLDIERNGLKKQDVGKVIDFE
jgi:hypothetical protein